MTGLGWGLLIHWLTRQQKEITQTEPLRVAVMAVTMLQQRSWLHS